MRLTHELDLKSFAYMITQVDHVLHVSTSLHYHCKAGRLPDDPTAQQPPTCVIAADAPSGRSMAFTPAAMATGLLSPLWTLLKARWQATSDEEQAVLVGMQGPGGHGGRVGRGVGVGGDVGAWRLSEAGGRGAGDHQVAVGDHCHEPLWVPLGNRLG